MIIANSEPSPTCLELQDGSQPAKYGNIVLICKHYVQWAEVLHSYKSNIITPWCPTPPLLFHLYLAEINL